MMRRLANATAVISDLTLRLHWISIRRSSILDMRNLGEALGVVMLTTH